MNNRIRNSKLREQLKLAQCNNSYVAVAACLHAANGIGLIKDFYASNIEVARSYTYHAEEMALLKAINEGYTNPLHIYVASNSPKHRVPLCPRCIGLFFYVNYKCLVTVLDENFKETLTVSVEDTQKYPYYGQGFIK